MVIGRWAFSYERGTPIRAPILYQAVERLHRVQAAVNELNFKTGSHRWAHVLDLLVLDLFQWVQVLK